MSEVATLLGIMLALYSACQFLFSPVLGVLSDRFGRRPVLLVSLAGAAATAAASWSSLSALNATLPRQLAETRPL